MPHEETRDKPSQDTNNPKTNLFHWNSKN
jgi:hypothetical protein